MHHNHACPHGQRQQHTQPPPLPQAAWAPGVLRLVLRHALRQLSSQHAQPLLQRGQAAERLKALAGVDGLDLSQQQQQQRQRDVVVVARASSLESAGAQAAADASTQAGWQAGRQAGRVQPCIAASV